MPGLYLYPDSVLIVPCTGAFYMVGDFASAREKGEKILADLEKQ